MTQMPHEPARKGTLRGHGRKRHTDTRQKCATKRDMNPHQSPVACFVCRPRLCTAFETWAIGDYARCVTLAA
jgi:hypothetical protein